MHGVGVRGRGGGGGEGGGNQESTCEMHWIVRIALQNSVAVKIEA